MGPLSSRGHVPFNILKWHSSTTHRLTLGGLRPSADMALFAQMSSGQSNNNCGGKLFRAGASPVLSVGQPVGPAHTAWLWRPLCTSQQTHPRRNHTIGAQHRQSRAFHGLLCSCPPPAYGALHFDTLLLKKKELDHAKNVLTCCCVESHCDC